MNKQTERDAFWLGVMSTAWWMVAAFAGGFLLGLIT